MNSQKTETQLEEEFVAAQKVQQTKIQEMAKAYDSLKGDKRFQLLISDGYCGEFAVNQVGLLDHPSTVVNGTRAQIMEDLIAISKFRVWLKRIESLEVGG